MANRLSCAASGRGLPVGLCAVLACWLAHQPASLLPRTLCVLGLAASGLLLAFHRRFRATRRPFIVMLALLGVFFSSTQWRAHDALAERLSEQDEGKSLEVTGYVDDLPVRFERGVRFGFRVQSCHGEIVSCRAGQLYRLSSYTARNSGARHSARFDPRPGQRWRLEVRLKRVHGLANPGLFDAELRALEDQISARGYVRSSSRESQRTLDLGQLLLAPMVLVHRLRYELRERMYKGLRGTHETAQAVIVALVIGDQSGIRPADWETFNRTGIGHLISISGLHITLLAGIAHFLVRRLWSAQWLRSLSNVVLVALVPTPVAARVAAVVVGFAYSALAGWGIPAQRTCWMLAFALLASLGNRGAGALNVLAGALVVVLLIDPWAVLAPGFWLSFAAVAAIVWFGAPVQQVSQERSRWAMLTGALRSQWAVSLALIPLGALFFNSVSLSGPLANAFAIPVVSFLVTPVALVSAAVLPISEFVGGWGLWLGASIFEYLMVPLRWLDRVDGAVRILAAPDHAGLLLSVLGLAMALSRVLPGRAWALLAVTPLLIKPDLRPSEAGEFWVTALDVGQGMAVLVETREGRLLFDTGPLFGVDSDAGQRIVAPYLRWRGIGRLDVLAVSHRDNDHSGGVVGVIRSLEVGRVLSSIEPPDAVLDAVTAKGIAIDPCRRGDSWEWSGVRFEWLHPGPVRASSRRSVTNANSCVLRIASVAGSILLTGDIETAQEHELIAQLPPALLKADALLVPHHGSRTSSSPEWLRAVSPEMSIFQLGYRNRYRHPHPLVWSRYLISGGQLLRSDRDGAVEVRFVPGRPAAVGRYRVDKPAYWRVCVESSECSPAL